MLVEDRRVLVIYFLLDGIGGEGLTVSELLGLDGLEELDAFRDDLTKVSFVFGAIGGHRSK